MKKLFSIFPAFILAASLTACSTGDSPENSSVSITDSSENSSVSAPSESSSALSSSESSTASIPSKDPAGSETEPDLKTLIENFALGNINLPDGSTISKWEAAYARGGSDYTYFVGFDFAFVRYAKPIFYNTMDDPNLINWDTLEFNVDFDIYNEPVNDPNFIRVKAGDTLENGLTVKTAEYHTSSNYDQSSDTGNIYLEGELTLNGIFGCLDDGEFYNQYQGDLVFFADTTQFDKIPLTKGGLGSEDTLRFWIDPKNKLAVCGDLAEVRLGNIKDTNVDLSGVVSEGEYVKAKVTFKDPIVEKTSTRGRIIRASLVSAEKL